MAVVAKLSHGVAAAKAATRGQHVYDGETCSTERRNRMRKIAALLALVLLVGCGDPKVSVELKGQPAAAAPPRYQVVSTTHGLAQTFLLDTQRGRVWRYEPDAIGQSPRFQKIEIIDDEGVLGMTPGQFLQWREHTEREKQESTTQVEEFLNRRKREHSTEAK